MPTLKFLRERSDLVFENIEKRNDSEKKRVFSDFLAKDREWRENTKLLNSLRFEKNNLTEQVKQLRARKKNASVLLEKAKNLSFKIKELEQKNRHLKKELDFLFLQVPNLLHDSVPFGRDDSENVRVKEWGEKRSVDFELEHHGRLASKLGIADFDRAVKIAGSGFFFLLGDLALLDFALQRFALEKLVGKGFLVVQPPFIMNREPYEGVTDLSVFEEVIYKLEGEEKYLIATSEHPMAAMFMNEILSEKILPLRLAGVSSCFRKEIGKHGIDERGFFRVHQFNKIEQFVFCKPDASWTEFEELARNSEELLEELRIPYERVNVCTGDIGEVAAKKYDINAWSPREKKYIELMSCSNCTDYQAVRLKIRYRKKGSIEKDFVHTLNNTMVATTRALRIILETYQTGKGTIEVPKVLRKYLNGLEEIKQQKRF